MEAEFHLRIGLTEDREIGIWLSSRVQLGGGKQEILFTELSRSWEPYLCNDSMTELTEKDTFFFSQKRNQEGKKE